MADREVLQDQVVVVELQNEELKETVEFLQAEASATQLQLETYMRRVEEVCVIFRVKSVGGSRKMHGIA